MNASKHFKRDDVINFVDCGDLFPVPLLENGILFLLQVVQRFQELFSQTKYKEAAELAAESPQGILRTPDTVAKFQVLTSRISGALSVSSF